MLREGRSREKSHLLARIHETEARGHPTALMSPDQIKLVRSIVSAEQESASLPLGIVRL